MPRPPRKEIVKKQCLKCEKLKNIDKSFYFSNSANYADKKYPVCIDCILESLNTENPFAKETILSIQTVLLEMNRPFIYQIYESSVEESKKRNMRLFGTYMKNIGMQQYRDYTWKESEFDSVESVSTIPTTTDREQSKVVSIKVDEEPVTTIDIKAKYDVLRLLGYDPFIYENEKDKLLLYNNIIDFLDESTLEDGFKLQAVIEIVKGFNQIDKINHAITTITNDIDKLNSGGITSLVTAKKNILDSLLKLAKDNGISVNNNNNKSKGAGTLSGIIKTLQEKGFEEGEVNLYDIETAIGMKQVADISNQSIVAQLQFDENDYTAMILEQREIIQDLETKAAKFEEENRILKKELISIKRVGEVINE